ncbi:MAG: FecR family protein [Nitrospirae bacterium YQR-1]
MSIKKKIILILMMSAVVVAVYNVAEKYFRYKRLINEYVIDKLEGYVTVQNRGKPELRAKKHESIKPGDIIRTVDNSKTDVVFKNRAAVRVTENTALEVDKDGPDAEPQTKLTKGAVLVKITHKLAADQGGKSKKVFSVQTPQAVAGVRGTSFLVKYNDEIPRSFMENVPGTEVAVLEGTVSFSVSGSTQEIDITKERKAVVDHFSTTPRLSYISSEDETRLEEIADIETSLKFSDFLFSEIRETFSSLICPVVTRITKAEMSIIESALSIYSYEHEGKVPRKLTELKLKKPDLYDSCGVPYLYKRLSPYKAEIRSAGADMEFFTKDDLVRTFQSR